MNRSGHGQWPRAVPAARDLRHIAHLSSAGSLPVASRVPFSSVSTGAALLADSSAVPLVSVSTSAAFGVGGPPRSSVPTGGWSLLSGNDLRRP